MSITDKENFLQISVTESVDLSQQRVFTNTIVTNLTAVLTCDQRRALLFNIQQLFEVPMKEFDDEWWPLVMNFWVKYSHKKLVNGNSWKTFVSWYVAKQKVCVEQFQGSPDHTHNLDESNKLKHLQAIRTLVKKEAVKNYPVLTIVNAVKEYTSENLDLGMSVKELRWRKVANIKYKVCGPQNMYFTGTSELAPDIQDSISLLQKEGYQVESYKTHCQSISSFVFAQPKQLKKLQWYGWLTLIDSTHKTNKYDWRLFTLFVRDGYGCWNIGGHFFVSNENSDNVAEALVIIRRFCRTWKPRYFLADQSSIEAKCNVKVFPGLTKGEQECDPCINEQKLVVKCSFKNQLMNVPFTLLNNISQDIIQKILTNGPFGPPALATTFASNNDKCSGIQLDSDYVAFAFRVKKISAVGVNNNILKEIHKFPFPVQKLIVNEVFAVNDRIEKGKGLPGLMSLECYCLFFRKYMLPCKHIFHEQIYGFRKLLTINTWKKFQQMFDENGLEIYKHRELVSLESFEKDEVNKAAENRKLTVNELMERTRNEYWRIEENGNEEEKVEFIQRLRFCLDP
ncbi:7486_t:CDS:2, partial [Cetraspora pellucida]